MVRRLIANVIREGRIGKYRSSDLAHAYLPYSYLIFINVSSSSVNWSHSNFLNALFQSVSIMTSTGYVTADYELWPYFSQYLILILMFLGGMGGSTTGGMKISRIILLIKYAATETRRMLHSRAIIPIRIGNRFIGDDVIRNTLGFFLFYISINFVLVPMIFKTTVQRKK